MSRCRTTGERGSRRRRRRGEMGGHRTAELMRVAQQLSCADVERLLRVSCGCHGSDLAAFAGVAGPQLLRLARRPAELSALLNRSRCPRRRQDRIRQELRNLPALLWGLRRRSEPMQPRPPAARSGRYGAARLEAALRRSSAHCRRSPRRNTTAPAPAAGPTDTTAGGVWKPPWREGWLERVEAALERRAREERERPEVEWPADDWHRSALRAQQTREQKLSDERRRQAEEDDRRQRAEEARLQQHRRALKQQRLRAERDERHQVQRRHDRECREHAVQQLLDRRRQDADVEAAIASTKRELSGGRKAEVGRRVSVVARMDHHSAAHYARTGARSTADVNTCGVGPPSDGWSPLQNHSASCVESTVRPNTRSDSSDDSPLAPKDIMALLDD
eukprot:TRINITY_DN13266_c0_g1_i2.p1 TRINITY_DN13266_c0_g1~~TRINITY_DN13266_c0_g1_i2.p1  ORF type:complete len:391 (+),score=105.57 TRINITY_DN13266_c0_g1_i2:179-1351(+)